MPYDIIKKFENTIAKYTGARYAVAVDSCTNAIFLSLLYHKHKYTRKNRYVVLPNRTYPGVAHAVLNAGFGLEFSPHRWSGMYGLKNIRIYDAALRFKKGMYHRGYYMMCLSFHIRKHIPIGRGGMILTHDTKAVEWLRRVRFDGRNECSLKDDHFDVPGYNMYMTPEQAARGLQLFHLIKDKELADIPDYITYPDLSKFPIFNKGAI